MNTHNTRLLGLMVATMVFASLIASPAFAQTLPPTTVNYSFDVPLAKVIPNPCNGGFTLVNGTAHVAIAATTSSTGFELAVGLSGSGTGIDVSATGVPIITSLPQYIYDSSFGATTTFPDGVPDYFERTLVANDYLIRNSTQFSTNDSYSMNTTFRLVFTNGSPAAVPVLESVSVACD